jgi:hypothetical protein
VELALVLGEIKYTVEDRSNVPLGIDWQRALVEFVVDHNGVTLPSGEYIFTVQHGAGFRVADLPTEGLSEETRRAVVDWIQPYMEEIFRVLCVGLVCFPTSREIRLAAQGILQAGAHTAIKALKDPDKLQSDFLTIVPAATDRLGPSRKIEHGGMVALVIQEGGISLPGGMVAMPGVPDETGHLEVKVGYLPTGSINDWLNTELVKRLTADIEKMRPEILAQVAAQFEDKRAWYEKAGARIKSLLGL